MAESLFYKVLEIAKKEKCDKEQTIRDLLTLAKNQLGRDKEKGLIYTRHIKLLLDQKIKQPNLSNKVFYYNCYFNTLVLEVPYSLDSFFLALEFNRPAKEQFYLPRRKQLLSTVRDVEDLLINDELDELFTSEPPRIGKTTLAEMSLLWLMGIDSERTNLYASCGSTQVNTFFKGLCEILNDSYTYNYFKIFPNVKFDKNSFINSKECYLDLGRIKRYHTFTGKSIDAESLNGTCDCNGLLIGDDLCSGIEEAQSPERLESLWQKVNNNLITRVKMGGKIWWIGTRWSLRDPIARRLNSLEGTNIRYRVHDTPALDEKTDESNFDFLFGVGFTTEYYRRRRLQFEQSDDNASWLAQYQQQPIERTGLLFPPDEMPTYNGVLPTDRPDKIFGHCDPAWGGGDYVVLPILIKFGDEYYCPDMVCDPSNKNVTIPKVAHKIADWGMTQVRFEKNNGGQEYKEAVDRELVKLNYKINTTCDYADNTKSKETRIFNFAPDIRKIHFLDPQKRTPEYQKGFTMLISYTINGKNKHDDVPDAFAGSMQLDMKSKQKPTVRVFERPF